MRQLLFLPLYSFDCNSIGRVFSKLKARLRRGAERTIYGLWDAIGRLLDVDPLQECAYYFADAGYDAE